MEAEWDHKLKDIRGGLATGESSFKSQLKLLRTTKKEESTRAPPKQNEESKKPISSQNEDQIVERTFKKSDYLIDPLSSKKLDEFRKKNTTVSIETKPKTSQNHIFKEPAIQMHQSSFLYGSAQAKNKPIWASSINENTHERKCSTGNSSNFRIPDYQELINQTKERIGRFVKGELKTESKEPHRPHVSSTNDLTSVNSHQQNRGLSQNKAKLEKTNDPSEYFHHLKNSYAKLHDEKNKEWEPSNKPVSAQSQLRTSFETKTKDLLDQNHFSFGLGLASGAQARIGSSKIMGQSSNQK